MPRLLLLISKKSYRAHDFLEAARRLRVNITVGSDHQQTLADLNPVSSFFLNFQDIEEATAKILEFSREHPISSIVPLEEDGVILAATASRALGLPYNSVTSVQFTRNKYDLRKVLAKVGLLQPKSQVFSTRDNSAELAPTIEFPCVMKPLFLAASRGVMRADDIQEFCERFHRLSKILQDPEVITQGAELAEKILVESFIPGIEVALEGILEDGKLHTLALFDKPDPLNGPFFEETIYVIPSRLPASLQMRIRETSARAAQAIGLQTGPIHAELRLNDEGVWLIELAARSIGGLCSRVLHFGTGMTLEELILRQALGELPLMERERKAAGVMMIPIPQAGILLEVRGKEKAQKVPFVEEIDITIPIGQTLVPLPEGSKYLGFIFARAGSPEKVEAAIREAHHHLSFVIE